MKLKSIYAVPVVKYMPNLERNILILHDIAASTDKAHIPEVFDDQACTAPTDNHYAASTQSTARVRHNQPARVRHNQRRAAARTRQGRLAADGQLGLRQGPSRYTSRPRFVFWICCFSMPMVRVLRHGRRHGPVHGAEIWRLGEGEDARANYGHLQPATRICLCFRHDRGRAIEDSLTGSACMMMS